MSTAAAAAAPPEEEFDPTAGVALAVIYERDSDALESECPNVFSLVVGQYRPDGMLEAATSALNQPTLICLAPEEAELSGFAWACYHDELKRIRDLDGARVLLADLPGWKFGEPLSRWLARRQAAIAEEGSFVAYLLARSVEFPWAAFRDSREGFVGFVGSAGEVFEKFSTPPRPLSACLAPVPPLDPALLPPAFRGWLGDHAERTCLALDYAAASALSALGSLVSRVLGIRPKRRDDWLSVPVLWGAIVNPPGFLKSEGYGEGQRFLRFLQAQAAERYAGEVEVFKRDAMIGEAQAKAAKAALEKAAKAGASRGELEELARQAAQAAECDPPPACHYIAADSTIEALCPLLINNPGILVARDELAGWLRTMDRQGHEGDRAFYLESWRGLEPYAVHRIGRGHLHVPRNCVTVFGTIQPGPMARYIREASTSGEGADGLLQRFQLLVYPDPPAEFLNVDRLPNTTSAAVARAVFERVANLNPAAEGLPVDERHGLPYLSFSGEAQEFFDGWRTNLENRLRSGELSPIFQAHLGKYRSLMPNLALLFHLVDVAGHGPLGSVSLESAERAAAWCEYLESHARRIYGSAFEGDIEPAQRLLERLKSLPNPFTYRVVAQKGWAGLSTTEDVRRACGVLEEHGWVLTIETPAGPAGGRTSEKVYIHPKAAKPDGGAEL